MDFRHDAASGPTQARAVCGVLKRAERLDNRSDLLGRRRGFRELDHPVA